MPAPTNLIAVPAMNVGATIGRPTTSPARHVRPPLQTLRRKKNPPGGNRRERWGFDSVYVGRFPVSADLAGWGDQPRNHCVQ